jgi:hypothetical protein
MSAPRRDVSTVVASRLGRALSPPSPSAGGDVCGAFRPSVALASDDGGPECHR